MLHLALVIAFAGPCQVIPGQNDEPTPNTGFGKLIRVPSNIGFGTAVSPDGQAATVIFDNMYVEIPPARKGALSTHNQTAVQTKVLTIDVPYTVARHREAMYMDIRGFVHTRPGASARLVVCAGDKTKIVTLQPQTGIEVKLKGKLKNRIAAERPKIQLGDFYDRGNSM